MRKFGTSMSFWTRRNPALCASEGVLSRSGANFRRMVPRSGMLRGEGGRERGARGGLALVVAAGQATEPFAKAGLAVFDVD